MRRSWVWAILLLVVCLAAVAGGLGYLLKQEPAFYTRPEVASPHPDDPYRASDVQTRLSDLQKTVFTEPEWGALFTQDDLNAFFREDPGMNNLVEPRLGGLTTPRVMIEGDRLFFAARYGRGFWSTIVSVELRAWLIADEPDLFAVEVMSFRGGALPLSKRLLMDKVTEFANDNYASITWFRNGANPVAVCRWLPNQSRPSTLLQTVEIGDGRIEIGGRNVVVR